MSRPVFLRWLLVQSFMTSAFVAAAVAYDGGLHPAAVVAGAAVLAVYTAASAYAGYLAWHEDRQGLPHIGLAIRVLPMLAILGTATGFLIAFEGDVSQVQQRVAGASTGIITTILGVACTISLMAQRHVIEE